MVFRLAACFLWMMSIAVVYPAFAEDKKKYRLPDPPPFFSGGVEIEVEPRMAGFLVLDKITGRKKTISINTGEVSEFGTLFVRMRHCIASAPEAEQQEVKVFVEIYENPPGDNRLTRVFNGWMFASSPAINALEHPVYDIWPISCKARKPDTRSGRR